MERLIGKVTRDMHRSATYVRVNVPQFDSCPLSLRASIRGFDRSQFKQGVVVEVEPWDRGSRFKVVTVFDPVDVEDEDCRCDSEERPEFDMRWVRFFLGVRYYKEPRDRELMQRLLVNSLSMSRSEAIKVTGSYGTWIVCRLDQFARFLIVRDRAGFVNGFADLKVEYVDSDEKQKKVIQVAGRD